MSLSNHFFRLLNVCVRQVNVVAIAAMFAVVVNLFAFPETALGELVHGVAGYGSEGYGGDRWKPDADDVLNVKLGALTPRLEFNTDPSGDATAPASLNLLPSAGSKVILGLGYRNLGITLSKGSDRTASERQIYGDGDSTDIFLQFFGRSWTHQIFYQNYEGYYIENSTEILPSLPANLKIARPDIKTAHYGVNFIYNFKPENYSPRVTFDQTARQLESGGSWLAMASFHNYQFRSRPQLLPSSIASKYGELATLESGNLLQASISGGGGYTYVFRERWYLTGQMLWGVGGGYENFETNDYVYKRTATSMVSNVALGLGYNGEKFYLGVAAISDNYNADLPSLKLRVNSVQTLVSYGYRFENVNIPWGNTASAWVDRWK